MYLRAITDIEDWDSNEIGSVDRIPIVNLNNFFENENEYSVFKVDSIENRELLDKIALRLFSSSPNKWSTGFHLMLLNESVLKELSKDISDDPVVMNCIHANIKNVCYSDFKVLVEYTYNLYNGKDSDKCFVEYTTNTLASLFNKMNKETFTSYIDSCSTDEKRKNSLVKKICDIFYKPPKKRPEYLNN